MSLPLFILCPLALIPLLLPYIRVSLIDSGLDKTGLSLIFRRSSSSHTYTRPSSPHQCWVETYDSYSFISDNLLEALVVRPSLALFSFHIVGPPSQCLNRHEPGQESTRTTTAA